MKVVSLIDSEFFTRGKVYPILMTSNGKYGYVTKDEKGNPHYMSQSFIFNNFSVLTFEEVR